MCPAFRPRPSMISTHASRTGSDNGFFIEEGESDISTHASRTGSDSEHRRADHKRSNFNPRFPHGERPALLSLGSVLTEISTHASRTGSDFFVQRIGNIIIEFQPTLPARGATTASPFLIGGYIVFQPTLPARGATP